MTVYAKGVSVLMPGEQIPTFIAHPAPAPCPPERILQPLHQYNQSFNFTSSLVENNWKKYWVFQNIYFDIYHIILWTQV